MTSEAADRSFCVDDQRFWAIIESGGRKALGDPERQLAAVRKGLKKEPPAEVRDFQRLFNRKMADAYSWDLWGAAYLINGGCSDDGFAYFRAWLISQGQEVYAAALGNPDSLAGLMDTERDDYEFEELWGVAQEVYQELTAEEMPAVAYPEAAKPKGKRWDFDDDEKMSRRFPTLAKLYTE
jgi:hypothetical protein